MSELSHKALNSVMRPGRYIGAEWNMTKKDSCKVKFHACLCFPEIYDLGMSHLGFRILYDVLNSKRDIFCERSFCPWPDFKKQIKDHKIKLSSLETNTPLSDFDLIGFSINNELNYSNILSMLDLAGIPLMAKERQGKLPLVIAGGNCVLNPEPLADFFDLFVIGEAEEVLLDIIKQCKNFKKQYGNLLYKKDELLLSLSEIPGVYVPSFYNVAYSKDFTINDSSFLKKDIPSSIKKIYVRDFNKNLFPQSWIVPNIEIVHDRIGIEIMRGCRHHCRFCQARSHFFPLRFRSPDKILKMAKKLYRASGYEEITLLSLSSSCHPQIKVIMDLLSGYFKSKSVSIAFPSMRPKDSVKYISFLLSQHRKTGLTFAPEAGTERLRQLIRKDFDIEELKETTKTAYQAGYRRIKLYFMIGLPKEEDDDLKAIVDLAHELSSLRKTVCNRFAEINISVSTFIPKPHTPLQWMPMVGLEAIKYKQEYLLRISKKFRPYIKLNFHNPYMCQLEAALSRGHRDLSKVIASAYGKGAQFDQWKEHFNFNLWKESFQDYGIDIEDFACRSIDVNRNLIWDFIDTGIGKQHFKDEFFKAMTF